MKMGSRKKLKAEKSQKIRTLPTRPLHAVLDELIDYRNYVLIIALNKNHVSIVRRKKGCGSIIQVQGMEQKRGENIEQAESTLPADGPNAKGRCQAKAFFHEVRKPRKEWRLSRQPKTGPKTRMGNISPLPQNLHRRGSSLESEIDLNQSMNFNFKITGN